jgi:hypothetical protein
MALTLEELTLKGVDGTLSVREAIDFVQTMATVSESAKGRANALIGAFDKLGLDIDMPYKDLKKTEIIDDRLGPSKEPYRSNQYPNVQALENAIRPVFDQQGILAVTEDVVVDGQTASARAMYPVLTGITTGRTQRTGRESADDEDARPMRGVIEKEKLDDIYNEALPEIEKTNPKAARLLEYHKITANRPAQLFRLKKSDVTLVTDDNGNVTSVKVKGKKTTKKDKKGRPDYEWDINSRGGQLVFAAYNESESDLLFDVKKSTAENLFKKHITPRLQPYTDLLPLMNVVKGDKVVRQPFQTIGVIRSIVPTYLKEQFKIREDLVEGVMGHKDTSTLAKFYTGTGLIPTRDIPFLLDTPENFGAENFRGGLGENFGNVIRLSDEQVIAIRDAQFELKQTESLVAKQTALNKFLTLVEQQPAYDPAKVQAAGRAAGEARFLFDEAEQAAYDERVAQKSVDAELAGNGPQEVVIFSDEQVETFKQSGMWNDDLQRIQDEAVARRDAASKGSTTGQKLGVGLMAGSLGMGLLDPAQAIADEAIQQTGQAVLRPVLGTLARRIPIAEILIANPISRDPQEVLGEAYNVSPRVFYDMSPEQMAPYQRQYDLGVKEAAAMRRERAKPEMLKAAEARQFDFGDEFGNVPDPEPVGFVTRP